LAFSTWERVVVASTKLAILAVFSLTLSASWSSRFIMMISMMAMIGMTDRASRAPRIL